MIEKTLFDYLSEQLAPTPVFMEKPSPLPDVFVLIEKTGASRTNRIESARFAFQSYDETLYKTAELNERVKEAVDSIIELDEIGSAHFETDYPFTDISNKRYRYQSVYNFTFYKEA